MVAIEGFTASLALELETFNVRAKLLEPGYGPTTRFTSNTGSRMERLIPEALVLTKSPEWGYEKEWRIVRLARDEDGSLFTDLAFSPCSLSRIFLGCRISTRNRRAIERLIARDYAHVEIHEARQSQTRFALKFERIH